MIHELICTKTDRRTTPTFGLSSSDRERVKNAGTAISTPGFMCDLLSQRHRATQYVKQAFTLIYYYGHSNCSQQISGSNMSDRKCEREDAQRRRRRIRMNGIKSEPR